MARQGLVSLACPWLGITTFSSLDKSLQPLAKNEIVNPHLKFNAKGKNGSLCLSLSLS
jgi:hypothetical protein